MEKWGKTMMRLRRKRMKTKLLVTVLDLKANGELFHSRSIFLLYKECYFCDWESRCWMYFYTEPSAFALRSLEIELCTRWRMEFFPQKHSGVGRDSANLTAELGQMIWNDFVRQSLPKLKISYRQLSVQKLQKWTKSIKKLSVKAVMWGPKWERRGSMPSSKS